jgi:hypothetical protein
VKLKSYEVTISDTDTYKVTVQAKSKKAAVELIFNDGVEGVSPFDGDRIICRVELKKEGVIQDETKQKT